MVQQLRDVRSAIREILLVSEQDRDVSLEQRLKVSVPIGKTIVFQNQALTLINVKVVAALQALDQLEEFIEGGSPSVIEAEPVIQIPERTGNGWKECLEHVAKLFVKRQYTMKDAINRFKKRYIQEAADHDWTKSKCAERLGMSRAQLNYDLDKYNIKKPQGWK